MLWSYDQGILVVNILGSAEISWGLQWPIWSESFLPFLLSRIGLTISVPAFPLSDAVHCNRPRSALQPPLQCTATAPAVHCIRPCKYVHPSSQVRASVLASTCFSTEPVFLLSHIWTVYGRFGMFPASLKYMRGPPQWVLNDSESTFEIQMVSYFFESEVKCQNRKRGKTSEDLFDLIQ